MSHIDNEIKLLKQKITILQEQKRIDMENDETWKVNPLMILEDIIRKKQTYPNVKHIALPEGRKPRDFAMSTEGFTWALDQNDKVEFLEPILSVLKRMDKRIDILEQNKKTSSLEDLF